MIDLKPAHPQHSNSRAAAREWLLNALASGKFKPGDRLPPSRELAKRLNVSLSTMQAALRELNQAGVVSSQVGRGTYLLKKPERNQREVRIILGFPVSNPPRPDTWHGKVVSALIQAGLSVDPTITWVPLQKVGNRTDGDALILLPGSRQKQLLSKRFHEQGKTVLHYNAPALNATTGFVSPDYFQASALLATSLAAAGRTRLAILYSARIQSSVSSSLRSAGFMSPLLKQLGKSISVEFFGDNHGDEISGYDTTTAMLRQGYHPDAIYCFGDRLALGAVKALQQAGMNVPQQVSVIGGSGLDLRASSCPGLTILEQPFTAIGEKMVAMILDSIHHPGRPLPGHYLPCRFSGGATTTAAENQSLSIS